MQSHLHCKMHCVTPCLPGSERGASEQHQPVPHRVWCKEGPVLKESEPVCPHTWQVPGCTSRESGNAGQKELLPHVINMKGQLVSLTPAFVSAQSNWAVSTLKTTSRECSRTPHSLERGSSEHTQQKAALSWAHHYSYSILVKLVTTILKQGILPTTQWSFPEYALCPVTLHLLLLIQVSLHPGLNALLQKSRAACWP